MKTPGIASVVRCSAAALALALAAASGPARAQEPEDPGGSEGRLLSRIDFGNAYVMGQTIQSGAVYLLNRKKSEIPSMLEVRRDFRAEIRDQAEAIDPAGR